MCWKAERNYQVVGQSRITKQDSYFENDFIILKCACDLGLMLMVIITPPFKRSSLVTVLWAHRGLRLGGRSTEKQLGIRSAGPIICSYPGCRNNPASPTCHLILHLDLCLVHSSPLPRPLLAHYPHSSLRMNPFSLDVAFFLAPDSNS